MPTVKYKYPVGKKVFYKGVNWIKENLPCLTCEGEGKLLTKSNKEIRCPQCGGSKTNRYNSREIEVVSSGNIETISIHIENGFTQISYVLDDKHGNAEDLFFETEEDVKKTFHNEVRGIAGMWGMGGISS